MAVIEPITPGLTPPLLTGQQGGWRADVAQGAGIELDQAVVDARSDRFGRSETLCVPAARLANLRAAAEELHLTHSAVSQQIKPALAQLDDGMLEVHTSQQIVDLKREAFHAALRQGSGQWPGLDAERLIDSPLIAVGSPGAARRLLGREPVALRDGRLMRLSTLALSKDQAYALWFAYPSGLRDWAPLVVRRAAAVRTGAACTGATAHPAACKRSASASISGASASGLSSPASAP